jgi:hypothetical protein
MKPPASSEHDEQVALFKMIRLYSIKYIRPLKMPLQYLTAASATRPLPQS